MPKRGLRRRRRRQRCPLLVGHGPSRCDGGDAVPLVADVHRKAARGPGVGDVVVGTLGKDVRRDDAAERLAVQATPQPPAPGKNDVEEQLFHSEDAVVLKPTSLLDHVSDKEAVAD